MRIEIDGTLLKMTPESAKEKDELLKLWNIVVGCIQDNKKLVPVGQYTPGVKDVAMFNIEEKKVEADDCRKITGLGDQAIFL